MTRRRCLAAGLAGLAGRGPAAAANPVPGVTERELVIGQNITLQGGRNDYGASVLQGMRLHLDAVNAAGSVFGRRLVLMTLDDDNQSARAEANARQLVQSGVFMLFGSIEGGPSTAVMKVAQEMDVPFFGPLAGAPSLRRPHEPMVFPVRAEHRQEFRALMAWGRSLGYRSVGFFHADSANGREHLANVESLARELGITPPLALPFKPDASDADLAALAATIAKAAPDMIFNHGSAGLYAKLVARARQAGVRANFMAVNSGSSQIAKALGPLAEGMVFAQVVPSPWERKHAIAREYQDAARRATPNAEFSYGGLEGYLTAKALVIALRAAGREPTRASLVKGLYAAGTVDLGGMKIRYMPGDHAGSQFVDLSMVNREGRFVH